MLTTKKIESGKPYTAGFLQELRITANIQDLDDWSYDDFTISLYRGKTADTMKFVCNLDELLQAADLFIPIIDRYDWDREIADYRADMADVYEEALAEAAKGIFPN